MSEAAMLLREYPNVGVDGRDASVVAAMRRYDVTDIWTHDGGLKRLGERLNWLVVRDPVDFSKEV